MTLAKSVAIPRWGICDGQRTFDGRVINVCDVCGLRIGQKGRHEQCEKRLSKAATIIERWSIKAKRKQKQDPKLKIKRPVRMQVLARIAGLDFDEIFDAADPTDRRTTRRNRSKK